MWFLPCPIAWTALWRLCRADIDRVTSSRPRRADGDPAEMLTLGSIGRRAALHDALYLPAVTQLLVDEVCLRSALCHLDARKPHWWRRRAAEDWRRAATLLEVERHRLSREAARLGSRLSPADVRRRGGATPRV